MKAAVSALTILFLLASCGDDLPKNEGGPSKKVDELIGSVKTLSADEKLTSEEADLILSACQGLERKRQVLQDLVDRRVPLKYKKSKKGCGDEEESKPESFESVISYDSGKYKYNESSPFSHVITDESFVMGDVCAHVKAASEAGDSPELPSRKIPSGEGVDPIWVSAFGQGSFECSNEEDIVCVYIETGSATSNPDSYRVRSVKSYEIVGEMDEPDRGFVSRRLEANLCVGEDDVYQYDKLELTASPL